MMYYQIKMRPSNTPINTFKGLTSCLAGICGECKDLSNVIMKNSSLPSTEASLIHNGCDINTGMYTVYNKISHQDKATELVVNHLYPHYDTALAGQQVIYQLQLEPYLMLPLHHFIPRPYQQIKPHIIRTAKARLFA